MTLVIAEAGVNHNGSIDLAIELVDKAADAGADIVKFQTFKANKLVTQSAQQADYQQKNTNKKESQLDMLRRLELPYEDHHALVQRCKERDIEFLSTAFDLDSLDFLVNEVGIKRLKIPSGDVTNSPLLLAHAQTGLDIILSTGMCNLSEIEHALGVIAFGYLGRKQPSNKAFNGAYSSEEGQKLIREKVTILHCTTEYPAPVSEINLNVMDTFVNAFGPKVGYSDHSDGIVIPIAAVARGAKMIEKHFTLDREMEGPDHKASLEPDELKEMIRGIRTVESALGSSIKHPTLSELKNIDIARKSLIAKKAIEKGDVLDSNAIDIKRPGGGISPSRYWDLLGKTSSKSYSPGDLLQE